MPLLIEYFGENWWVTGGMSVVFSEPVFDNQPVRCLLKSVSDTKVTIWMENEVGRRVVEGTASLGEDPESEVQARLSHNLPDPELRMLADVALEAPSPACPARVTDTQIAERVALTTEPLECYVTRRIAPVAPYVHAFRGVEEHIIPVTGPYVGMFGAIEVQYLAGPVVANVDYLSQGHVIALSASPKTEIVWLHRNAQRSGYRCCCGTDDEDGSLAQERFAAMGIALKMVGLQGSLPPLSE